METRIRGDGERYAPPVAMTTRLSEALKGTRRLAAAQYSLFGDAKQSTDPLLYYAGDISLLQAPCVAIVGTRKVSPQGEQRTKRIAEDLARDGIIVVSGLAAGVDTAALRAAIECGGRVVAVIGTPLDRAYPPQNKFFQEEIYRGHLLISQFPHGAYVGKANFPKRNRLMACISDATVVMEASDTSGTLHQAAECTKLGRWLFIDKMVSDDPGLTWPKKFENYETTKVLERASDVREIYSND